MANFTDSPTLTQRFTNALVLASQLHANQVRKGHIQCPYISHLMSVAALVIEMGGNEDEAIAALLHDSVEDTGYTLAEIETQFGKNVSSIVNCLTEDKAIENKTERKLDYLDNIKEGNDSVLRVALADKLHNGRSYLLNSNMITEEIVDFYGWLKIIFHPNCFENNINAVKCKYQIEELQNIYWKMKEILVKQ
jgi:(p)ppGpp synthase/HD superfamily hydrolase